MIYMSTLTRGIGIRYYLVHYTFPQKCIANSEGTLHDAYASNYYIRILLVLKFLNGVFPGPTSSFSALLAIF